MTKPDPRFTPYRDGLAAAHLKNRVEAGNYIDAVRHQVMMPVIPLHKAQSSASMMDTQLLLGAEFDIYDIHNGWAWGQEVQMAKADTNSTGYVGYVPNMALARSPRTPTHRIKTIRAPVFLKPDLKTAIRTTLPLNAKVFIEDGDGDYLHIPDMGFVHANHIAPLEATKADRSDFVAMAELHLGLPYIWGGISPDGVDCSGLVQTALRSLGGCVAEQAPRDTDMQEAALGTILPPDAALKRGDLVFWQGHVGIMRDATNLLHANAYHMLVASEPLKDAITRIEKSTGPVSSIKRL